MDSHKITPSMVHKKSNKDLLIDNIHKDKNKYFSIIKTDTNNYYYYNKEHEHVPGIMLIEMSRQLTYASLYFDLLKKGEVNIMMNGIEANFYKYVESCFEILCEIHITSQKKKIPRFNVHVNMTQRCEKKAEIIVKTTAMPLKLFKRIRKEKDKMYQDHVFIPNKKYPVSICNFWTSSISGNIQEISLKGVCVEISGCYQPQKSLVTLKLSNTTINGIVKNLISNGLKTIINIEFEELNELQKNVIKRIIKFFCFIKESLVLM